MQTELEQLRQQLAAANARAEALEAVNRRWYNAAMKHYPLNWGDDPGNPELVIGNIVRNIDDGHRALLAEAHKTIAALTERAERAERAEKLYEAARPLADMMSLAAFRSNPRMSDGYCPPMGGVKEYELRHQASAIRDAVEKYDTARREAGRDKP